ncbi:hypothetical protein BB560_004533 [Smittium megazygosporum]|uniref:Prefoldin subunit 6 n=1 Tax=Smittium megazygosporum TaxID=133381 RepID=A0A2T9Z949_9FUNG|nr:hypothetical protein BB560_004533 [Smittium megazygosporum]
MSVEAALEKVSQETRKIDAEYLKMVETSQKLNSQLQENELVKKKNSQVFKMIGPILVPQDQEEAALNVDKRIEYIKQELQ